MDLRSQEAVEGAGEGPTQPERIGRFGTFGGVFTPTLLTILGVIMFLREGWVIGNAGILGGALIILLSFGITTLTALSMSSIVTNIRIGAGGAYAIIAQSLGLEIGGALGIPRYLSQALAVTMYVFGFREGWRWIFPEHPALLVDVGVFVVLFAIAFLSADLAIRVQYVIMAVIVVSLGSVAMGAATGSMQYPLENIGWWGDFVGSPEDDYGGTSFWAVFAVFFPASTGIMAGANMSGELKTPRRSIPVGTMAAVGVSLVIYLALGYWLARSATPDELVSNYTVMMDKAYWGPAVLAGLLGATFSSALASLVGSARILMAMGQHRVLPAGEWLGRQTGVGEPRNAMLVTGVVLFGSILIRDLNAVAPLVTMFFLITYAMLNGVLLIEQSLGLASFRPRLRVPNWVPLLGLLGSLLAMFIIHPTVGWVSIAIVVGFYWLLLRRHLEAPFADIRSGLFVAMAEWAANRVEEMPVRQERAWKPNLLVPVADPRELRGSFEVLSSIAAPRGTVRAMGLCAEGVDPEAMAARLQALARSFGDRGITASATVINAPDLGETGSFGAALVAGMQALRGATFRPNAIFLRFPGLDGTITPAGAPEAPGSSGSDPDPGPAAEDDAELGRSVGSAVRVREPEIRRIIGEADAERIGTLLYAPHPVSGLGQRRAVNVWIRDRSPDWRISWDIGNLDLSLLLALKIQANWSARLRLLMAVEEQDAVEQAEGFLEDLVSLARLHGAEVHAEASGFESLLESAPAADLNLFGLIADPDFDVLRALVERSRSSCLFVRDSGQESVLA